MRQIKKKYFLKINKWRYTEDATFTKHSFSDALKKKRRAEEQIMTQYTPHMKLPTPKQGAIQTLRMSC